MSTGSLAKKGSELWRDIWERYQREHPGAFGVEGLVDWALEQNLADLPRVSPKAVLTRRIKRALREVRIQDAQMRTVRGMLPARIPTVDANGNLVFEVMWDHIHTMDAEHALLSFQQRDDNIAKQRRSATRDLQSFLDNNPNAEGCQHQFEFRFMLEVREQQSVERIEPTDTTPRQPR